MNVLLKLIKNRVARNAGWIITCKAVQAVFGLIISMLTARFLGPEKYGLVNYAASIVLFAGPVAQLGFTSTLVHELIQKPEEEGRILGSAILSSLISSALCIAGIGIFVCIANPSEPVTLLVCQLYSLLLLAQGLELIQYWFQSKLLSKYTAVTTLIVYILTSLYQVFVLLTGGNIALYALSKALQHGVIALVLLVIYHRMHGYRLSFSFSCVRHMLQNSRYYILSTLMVMTFSQADRIMIKSMIGDQAMGLYAAAVMCATCTDFLFVAIIDSFRPIILESKLRSEREFQEKMTGLYAIMIGLSLAQSVLITLLARPVLLILCGSAYLPAAGTLRIIVWYTAFSYIGSSRSIWIIAEEKQRLLLPTHLSGAVMNIALNLCLIPVWGIEGAAFASLLTQIFVNVITGFLIRPLRGNNRLLAAAVNPAAVAKILKKL